MVSKGYSPTSINMYLRSVRTFLTYLVDCDYISKKPKITQIPINEPDVKYLNESEIAELMRLELGFKNLTNSPTTKGAVYIANWEHIKDAFKFYLTTGCRRLEPFLGEIKGRWLDIPPEQSKNHKARKIKLTPENLKTLEVMRGRGKNYKNILYVADSYSKAFKKACKVLGFSDDLHLHSLRHTFACIRRLQTNGNMVQVRDELGHKSFETTQRYTNIPIERVEDDFPTYAKKGENSELCQHIMSTSALENEVSPR